MTHYFVRIGSWGEIAVASAILTLPRGRRVVIRSPRGTEIAEVTARCTKTPETCGFRILRPTTDSDERLARRLERHKQDAIEACRERLNHAGCAVTLLDVDQMLDGGTLKMHFLGDLDSVAQRIADEIATQYETIVQSDRLADLLSKGCGPDCGTRGACSTACAGCTGCG